MAIPLFKYKKIKDRVCLVYLGHSYEYLIQIRHLIPYIEKELPELQVYVCCRKEYCHIIEKSFPQEQLREKKDQFGMRIEIKNNLNDHPILKFLRESKIPFGPTDIPKIEDHTVKCAICPYGNLPVKSLTQEQQQNLIKMAKKEGMEPEITEDIDNAGWVIGVENGPIYKAASLGIKTTLIPTGLGTQLFKTLFPNAKILEL